MMSRAPKNDGLGRTRNVGEAHAVAERSEQEEGEDDAEDRAPAAIDVDSAEDDGGDDKKDQALGIVAAGGAVLSDPHQRGKAGQAAGEREGLRS